MKIKITLNAMIQNIVRMLQSKEFIVAILAAYILLASANVYVSMDTGKSYSIFSLILDSKRNEIIEVGGLNAQSIIMDTNDGYIWMFAPIVATIPFVGIICAGYFNTNLRFELYRIGKNEHVVSRIVSCMLVGGMVMAFSQVLYGGTVLLVINQQWTWRYILQFLSSFLYGMISTIPVLILVAFIKNKYLVLSMPFMMNYIFTMLFSSVIGHLTLSKHTQWLISQMFIPAEIQKIYLFERLNIAIIVSSYLVLFVLIGIWHKFILSRRCDCGA